MKAILSIRLLTLTAFIILASSNTLKSQWRETAKIVASDRAELDGFSSSVSISGDYAIVGAPFESEDIDGNNSLFASGSVYIFKKDVNDNWMQIQKIVAEDRTLADQFGWSVSISGEYVIIGAPLEDEDTEGSNFLNSSGSAYIFKNDGTDNWVQIQKIVPQDRGSGDRFGSAVSISGDYIIVSAPLENEDDGESNSLNSSGSAYLFKNDGNDNWIQVQKIVAEDRGEDDQFGNSVSISGNYVIVGVSSEDEDEEGNNTLLSSGSAYLFKNDGNDNWIQVQKIVAGDRGDGDLFGSVVSISGNHVIIGAPREDEDEEGNNSANASGSVYLFKNDGADNWIQIQKIVAEDRAANDLFGISISISGDLAIIGASTEDEDEEGSNSLTSSGSAYIIKNNGAENWVQVRKVVANDRASIDQFGSTVSISGNRAIVGAFGEDEDESGNNTLNASGSAYIFQYKDPQSITFNELENRKYGESFELPKTTDAGLDISYESTNQLVATTEGNTVSVVGLGSTTITASQKGDDNYWEAEEVTQTLSTDKAELTATADDQVKSYGDPNPDLTITYSGFAFNEDESVLSELPAIGTDADQNSNPGTYDITVSGGQADNYTLSHVNGTLTVNKAPLRVTAASYTLNEGESFPETFEFDYNGFVLNEDAGVIDTPPAAAPAVADSNTPGTYDIDVSGGADDNYAFTYEKGTLTINKVLSLLKENAITVYPNPTTSFIKISNDEVAQIEIYDTEGSLLIRSQSNELDLSAFQSGTYLLKLINKKGELVSSNRIVKQ